MKKISLSQGKVALVDDEDFAKLNLYKWYASEGNKSWYAVRNKTLNPKPRGSKVKGVKRIRVKIRMHNVIMNPSKDEIVHHKDSNGLNNQKYNMENTDYTGNNKYASEKRKAKEDEILF